MKVNISQTNSELRSATLVGLLLLFSVTDNEVDYNAW